MIIGRCVREICVDNFPLKAKKKLIPSLEDIKAEDLSKSKYDIIKPHMLDFLVTVFVYYNDNFLKCRWSFPDFHYREVSIIKRKERKPLDSEADLA